MTPQFASAIYEGRVRHRRHAPRAHAFAYRMAQLYLDLDEIDAVFRERWLWSVDRPNLARVLWRYPLMTAQVVAGIHWQALRLWLKRTPVHDHPAKPGMHA